MGKSTLEASRAALATLLEETIISPGQLKRAQRRLPANKKLHSPAVALYWMMESKKVLSRDEMWAIRHAAAGESMVPGAATRVAIVTQAEQLLAASKSVGQREFREPLLVRLCTGSTGWLAGGVLFCICAWKANSPLITPACNDPEVVGALRWSLMISQGELQPSAPNGLPSGSANGATKSFATLADPREAGFAKAERVRGCFATMTFDGAEEPIAYEIRPARRKDRFVVAAAHPRIVHARFTQIDADGNFTNTAGPVSRSDLEQAIRVGVDRFNAAGGNGPPQSRDNGADRGRELADIEPNGACRPVATGRRYICNVIFERNAGLADASGNIGTTITSADFTIERDHFVSPWRVSTEFPAQYREAISRGSGAASNGAAALAERFRKRPSLCVTNCHDPRRRR